MDFNADGITVTGTKDGVAGFIAEVNHVIETADSRKTVKEIFEI